jgi:hypothetical protein
MTAEPSLLDVTNTVSIGDTGRVAAAVADILAECFGQGSFDDDLLHATFERVGRMFNGDDPEYLACDMPYHDLRHSLDTALTMARLIAGQQGIGDDAAPVVFTPEDALLGVLLALLHDTGYIRTASERALGGPQLTREHEARSVEFARHYLRTTSLAKRAADAELIQVTQLVADLDVLFARHAPAAVALGRMLGTADLVSQLADKRYLERCYWHLFPELVLGDCNRMRTVDGGEAPLFSDALDLVSKTPAFYDNVVRPRLDRKFAGTVRHLAALFGDADPYGAAIERNIERARTIAGGQHGLLGPEPPTTTARLAPIYHAVPGR